MAADLTDRLNRIIPRLQDPAFLANEGIGNEIGFYIFDYPPEQELAVREAVAMVEKHFAKTGTVRIVTVNLLDVMLDVLKGRKVLDAVLKSETKWGPKATKSKIGPILKKSLVAEGQQAQLPYPMGAQALAPSSCRCLARGAQAVPPPDRVRRRICACAWSGPAGRRAMSSLAGQSVLDA